MVGVSHSCNISNLDPLDPQLTQTSDDAQQAHQDVYNQDQQPDNQGSFGHEMLAGAAGVEAMRLYQKHEEANGTLSDFAFAFPLFTSPPTLPQLHALVTLLTRSHPTTGVAENHTVAKDIMAGLAAGEVDKLVETHGENFYDREKMKRDAQQNAGNYYDQQRGGGDSGYGGNQGGDSGYGGNQGGDSGYGGNQGGY